MFKEWINIFNFTIRSTVKWHLGHYKPLFIDQSPDISLPAEIYEEHYNLNTVKTKRSAQNYKEILYTLDLLERHITLQQTNQDIKVLDIGCKNFFYAPGLHHFFQQSGNTVYLDGIELDGYRVYTDFRSRYDYAQFYIEDLTNTRYIIGDVMELNGQYNYITWILPFVFLSPLQAWGLPSKYFKPLDMLAKAVDLLTNDGTLLIVNQGKEEQEEQHKLLQKLKISYKSFPKPFESAFLSYTHERYVTVVQKGIDV